MFNQLKYCYIIYRKTKINRQLNAIKNNRKTTKLDNNGQHLSWWVRQEGENNK